MKLKCKDCKKYVKSADKSHGLCSLPYSWFPVEPDNICRYLSGAEIKCRDCVRFGSDLACLTADENDSAGDCWLFIDVEEENIYNIFWKWLQRGIYSREKITELCDEFESSEEYKFFQGLEKEENSYGE